MSTKLPTPLHRVLFALWSEGLMDGIAGEEHTGTGMYALVLSSEPEIVRIDSAGNVVSSDVPEGAEAGERVTLHGGYILSEDDRGFVAVEVFDNVDDARAEFARLETELYAEEDSEGEDAVSARNGSEYADELARFERAVGTV